MNKRRHNTIPFVVAVLAASLAACSSVRDAMEGHQNIVASAAGFTLTIDKAAELTAANVPRSIEPRANAVDQVVDLWVTYVLLADELVSPDEFADLDVEPLIEDTVARSIIRQFHEDVILTKVDSSDAALRLAYELEQPFLRVQARQIFISTSGATDAVLDSLWHFAKAIRERAVRGEDFGRLARQYSQDPTSAPQGGHLGWVGRGHFLADLEATLLAMQPGEVSETVRSAFGYHIFKVIDRESPDFESAREVYRPRYVQSRIHELETAYLDSLVEAAQVRIVQGAVNLAKRLAQSVQFRRLSTVSRAAVLARYRGGAFTVDDWTIAFNGEDDSEQWTFLESDSAATHDLLIEMVREKLIVEVANDLGYTISADELSSQADAAYRNLRTLARQAGLDRQELIGGSETIASAAERAVRYATEYRAQARALRRVSMPLYQKGTFQVYEDRYPAVIDRVLAIRQESSQ
jgi:hypothetical protein